MMRPKIGVGCVLIVTGWSGLAGVVAPGRALAQEVDAKSRFLAEAPAAWKALRTFADHVEIEGVYRNGITGAVGGRPDGKDEFRLVTDEPSRRVESAREGGHAAVFVLNPRYGFNLQRDSGTSPYQIKYVGAPDTKLLTNVDRYGFSKVRHAFGDWIAFERMLSGSKIAIKRATATRVDGEELVRVEFEADPKTIAPFPWRKGWITLAPDQLWGVRRFEVAADWGKSKGRATGLVEYGEKVEGLPSLRRTEFKTMIESGEQAGITDWQETTFTGWAHRDAPAGEFTLTSFGLPEIADPPQGTSSGARNWWLILAGLGFVATLALHLTRRGRSSR